MGTAFEVVISEPNAPCPCDLTGLPGMGCCLDEQGRMRGVPRELPAPRLLGSSLRNDRCYAAPLGGCSPKLSGEHFLSGSLLRKLTKEGEQLVVSRFPKQAPGESRTTSAENLKAKVLCKEHNSKLSEYDALFERFCMLVITTGIPGEGWVSGLFNGEDLDRSFLKVLCGVTAMEAVSAGRHWAAPLPWLNALYKTGGPLPPGLGLWLDLDPAFPMFGGLHFSLTPIDDPAGGDPLGLRFGLCGIEFVFMVGHRGHSRVLPNGRRFSLLSIEPLGHHNAHLGVRYSRSPLGDIHLRARPVAGPAV
jgi:hypothetical protein